MPNSSDHFGEKWFFGNLPVNHTIDDVAKLLFNMSNSINKTDSGQKSFSNTTFWERCKALLMVVTPEEIIQMQNNESVPTMFPEDIPFVMQCHNTFNYFNLVANLGRANNTHAENKAENNCDIYLAFNALLLGLVMLLAIGCLFYNCKNKCSWRRALTVKDSPLLMQGDSVNDSPDAEKNERPEFLSGNKL